MQLVCRVRRQAHKGDVVGLAQFHDLGGDVAGQYITNEQLLALLFPSVRGEGRLRTTSQTGTYKTNRS
jgi:hypothetical protein